MALIPSWRSILSFSCHVHTWISFHHYQILRRMYWRRSRLRVRMSQWVPFQWWKLRRCRRMCRGAVRKWGVHEHSWVLQVHMNMISCSSDCSDLENITARLPYTCRGFKAVYSGYQPSPFYHWSQISAIHIHQIYHFRTISAHYVGSMKHFQLRGDNSGFIPAKSQDENIIFR